MTSPQHAVFKEMPGAAPDVMRDYDLATLGYEETEFSVEGTATSYELQGERGADGHWEVTPGAGAPFRTRIVVRRPIDPARFSGTVVVEWNNVTAGIDAAPDWGFFHRHLTSRGHAWVGVSAQKVGIDGGGFVEGIHLKLLAPERYAELEHPGDAWSFDIFTQVGALLRLPADENPLRGLAPEQILAAGESQSAACLVTYINAIDPHARLFDGFFVHGRPGVGVSIDGVFIPSSQREGMEATRRAISYKGERIRQDARVPVLVLQSETDVILLGGRLAAQPDSERIRVWEMAGAAHADTYTVSAGRHDDGTLSPERMAELLRPTTNLMIGNTDDADQRRTPAALRLPRRPGPPGAVGVRRGRTPLCAPARAHSRRNGLPSSTNRATHSAASERRGSTSRHRSCRGSVRRGRPSPCCSDGRCPSTRRRSRRSTPEARRRTSSSSRWPSTPRIAAGFILERGPSGDPGGGRLVLLPPGRGGGVSRPTPSTRQWDDVNRSVDRMSPC